jgi:hypothetical protein
VYGIGMNNTNLFNIDPTDPAVIARRNKATNAFKDRLHVLWHEHNGGKDAPCHRCGNIPRSASGFNVL